ncbi:Thioesterase superfamily, partial [Rhizoctonia solani]
MTSGVTLDDIKGNAPDDQKQMCIGVLDFYSSLKDHFAYSVGQRLKLLEVSVGPMINKKSQAIVVCEISLEDDMLNLLGTLHGGCTAYLIDVCSSIAIAIAPQGVNNPEEWWGKVSVSQALNVLYHAPARSGTTLRIVSETIVLGGRAGTVRCEVSTFISGIE